MQKYKKFLNQFDEREKDLRKVSYNGVMCERLLHSSLINKHITNKGESLKKYMLDKAHEQGEMNYEFSDTLIGLNKRFLESCKLVGVSQKQAMQAFNKGYKKHKTFIQPQK